MAKGCKIWLEISFLRSVLFAAKYGEARVCEQLPSCSLMQRASVRCCLRPMACASANRKRDRRCLPVGSSRGGASDSPCRLRSHVKAQPAASWARLCKVACGAWPGHVHDHAGH